MTEDKFFKLVPRFELTKVVVDQQTKFVTFQFSNGFKYTISFDMLAEQVLYPWCRSLAQEVEF